MDHITAFEAERPRLTAIASRVLGDPAEAQDVVQQAWLRLAATDADIVSLPAWLTTVTTRLCLDRLRARVPVPVEEVPVRDTTPDPAEEVASRHHDRLSPKHSGVAIVVGTCGACGQGDECRAPPPADQGPCGPITPRLDQTRDQGSTGTIPPPTRDVPL